MYRDVSYGVTLKATAAKSYTMETQPQRKWATIDVDNETAVKWIVFYGNPVQPGTVLKHTNALPDV